MGDGAQIFLPKEAVLASSRTGAKVRVKDYVGRRETARVKTSTLSPKDTTV